MVKNRVNEVFHDVLFLGPAILFFSIIVVGSFVLGVYYAFTDWNGISLTADWVGFENFRTIFTDDAQIGRSAIFTLRLM
ncbi:MAG: sugar ABC transporter permease, partial [Spirochaetota bacterium]